MKVLVVNDTYLGLSLIDFIVLLQLISMIYIEPIKHLMNEDV
jgi:hypothetical protein